MVYPDSTEDVVKIVNVARKYRMPIVPYSGGTSVEGQFAGVRPLILPRDHFPNTLFCSGMVGVYASTCLEWIKLSLSMVRPTLRSASPVVDLRKYVPPEEDSDLVCQPGIGWAEINETLKEKGIPLFFPVRAQS